jgi:uncharacterized MAPEG superfamily protein
LIASIDRRNRRVVGRVEATGRAQLCRSNVFENFPIFVVMLTAAVMALARLSV